MVIVALDFKDKDETFKFLDLFKEPLFVKVGMELFYKEGPSIIDAIKQKGHQIFLDLKLHDIPNTVKKAISNLASLGADIINVHASGGIEMMHAAKIALKDYPHIKLIAVTHLTSTNQAMLKNELLIESNLDEAVLKLAQNAQTAGLDGVVCSPLEVELIKDKLSSNFITVTPGIRYSGSGDDQKRVTTPNDARKTGTDFIVVGRPITQAENPLAAYQKIKKDFEGKSNE